MITRAIGAVLLLLVACHPPDPLLPADADLRVSPSALDFRTVAVSSTATLNLELQNASVATLPLHVVITGPFDAQPDGVVAGGATVTLAVHFSPLVVGEATGTVTLRWGTVTRTIALHGAGVACPTPDVCHTTAIIDGACAAPVAFDGTACESVCLTGATCRAGTCVGPARSCADGDACTLDSCDPGVGCSHTPVACPASACSTATCNPQTGCGLTPVVDGTSCGDAVCAWADICLEGECTRASTPNASLECRYRDVVAAGDMTCAVTLSGHVKCWGTMTDPSWGGAFDQPPPQYVSPPTTMSGFTDIVAMAADNDFCAVDVRGVVKCGVASMSPTGGTASGAVSMGINGWLSGNGDAVAGWVLSSTGAVSTWARTGPLQPLAHAPVKQAYGDGYDQWFVDPLGNLEQDGVSVPTAAPIDVLFGYGGRGSWRNAVLYAGGGIDGLDGASAQGPSDHLWDAGALAVGGSGGPAWYFDWDLNLCVAQPGGRVICTSLHGGERRYQIPGEVMKLTQRGMWHVCALNDRGGIWCWGDNQSGQLNDDAIDVHPRFLEQRASSISVGFIVSDGGLYAMGSRPDADFDGGLERSTTTFMTAVGGAQFVGGTDYLLSGATLYDVSLGLPLTQVATGIASCGGLGAKGYDEWGRMNYGCTTVTGDVIFPRWSSPPVDGCQLERDGGVTCSATHVLLPSAATTISMISTVASWFSACAIVAGGQVLCWTDPGTTPHVIPGLSSGARQIQGTGESGCAVVGLNAVQCWGDNRFGALGQPGPSSSTAVTHTFDEPVVQLSASPWYGLLATVCVQLQSGRVACWGMNFGGSTGPMILHSEVPMQIVK